MAPHRADRSRQNDHSAVMSFAGSAVEPHWNHKPTNLIIEKLLYLRMPNSTFNQHSYSLVTSLVEHTQLARPNLHKVCVVVSDTNTNFETDKADKKNHTSYPHKKTMKMNPSVHKLKQNVQAKSCLEQSPPRGRPVQYVASWPLGPLPTLPRSTGTTRHKTKDHP